jgi:lipopolysaccharide export system permease protein
MRRTIYLSIIREITSLFLLGLGIFTLVLLMGRMIKLTEMVISRGVALADVGRMIMYLMPSFLVYTIPMAFLLAVLLTFGRLSSDSEITVMKACGISLTQILPPVLLCAVIAAILGLYAGVVGVPWGNRAFAAMSFDMLKQNVTSTIREKVFWDDIPGVVLYTEHYDEARHTLAGVVIYDGRDASRPLTIFASSGVVGGGANPRDILLGLKNGSIHSRGKNEDYRMIHFGEYTMNIAAPGGEENATRAPREMTVSELRRMIAAPSTKPKLRKKMATEMHSRFALPFASLVFAVLAVPLGLQNRRSARSFGFAISIGVLLVYYLLLSLLSTMAEKGSFPPLLALWIPNVVFLILGWSLLRLTSQERRVPLPSLDFLVRLLPRRS